jgi:hypothetical protein
LDYEFTPYLHPTTSGRPSEPSYAGDGHFDGAYDRLAYVAHNQTPIDVRYQPIDEAGIESLI